MTLTEEQVKEIFDRQIAVMKDFLKDGVLGPNDKGEIPEPWVGYGAAWQQRRQLGPHILTGEFPAHLFMDRAPNQTEEELEWLRKNYKQVTLPVFLDLENTVGRAMHPRNWSVEYQEDPASEDVKEYTERGLREWGSVFNFMRFAGLRLKVQDAMGVLAVLPTNIAVIEDADGNVVQDMESTMEPDIHYFNCEQLWGFEYDKWYLLRLNTNSWVDWYSKKKQTGVLCWLVDGENVWRIEQVGRPSDWQFNISLEFRHGIGFAPCINMMGTPSVKVGKLLWESPYLAAKDLLDVALIEEHYLRASKAGVCYPVTVMIGDPCEFVDEINGGVCSGGNITYFKDNEKPIVVKCSACNGTGQKGRLSPFGKLVINRNPDGTSTDSVNANNALAYVSPSTETLEFIRAEVDRYVRYARSILHLDAENPMAGGEAKTATEAGLNNRAKDAFVKTIADQLFVIHAFIIDCMGKMRHGAEWDGFTLRPPTNYDLRTEADHLEEIAQGLEKGLPPAIIRSMYVEYADSRYAGDPAMREALSILFAADRLVGMTKEMIQAEVAAGRVKSWEQYLHFAGMMLLEKLAMEQGFMDLDQDVQVERLIQAAQQAAQIEPPKSNPLLKLANAAAA